ncbi:MAG: S-adenosylmethionine:tRNA ribosyltransferase-isomerase, partial [Phycisphaerae bacterium]|nr:S-adenosylmethionine:tRNA ribosyltransferase-isomerase [Phycisphaerae bacterium]
MKTALLDYDLPNEMIAQRPAVPRDAARLMRVDRAAGSLSDHRIADLPGLLR